MSQLRPVIFPYRVYSGGAQELAEALSTYCVFPNKKYRPKPNHLVVVWGAGQHPVWWKYITPVFAATRLLNQPRNIGKAINKRLSFEALSQAEVSIPDWTTDKQTALKWFDKSQYIVCRKILNGSGGDGIVLAQKPSEVVDALLYSRHIRHKREFRVHVFRGQVIDIAEKRRRTGASGELNVLIRNIDKGWVFCHNNVVCPENAQQEAVKAVAALGLDFGAVDIGYRDKEQQPYVFEVNTAPGIEGTTVTRYADAIRNLLSV